METSQHSPLMQPFPEVFSQEAANLLLLFPFKVTHFLLTVLGLLLLLLSDFPLLELLSPEELPLLSLTLIAAVTLPPK